MFAKSLLCTIGLAGALALGATGAAHADPHVRVGIGLGFGGPDWNGGGYDGYYDGGDGDPYWRPRHHWQHRHWEEPAPIMSYGISCAEGRAIAANSGFHGVSALSCSGGPYRYIGWRHGEQFRICVNRHGNIISVNPVY